MKKSVLTLAFLGLVVSLAGCSLGGSTNDNASNNTGADVKVNLEEVVEELDGAIEESVEEIEANEEVVAEEVNVEDVEVTTGDVAEEVAAEVNVEDAEGRDAE